MASHEGDVQPDELWATYFCPFVRDIPTKDYIFSTILPRPRDLVFFVKAAIATAVNRGQDIVREIDILDDEKQYSQYALESILVENGVGIPNLETTLYEFAGSQAHLDETKLKSILTKTGSAPEVHSRIIENLCSLAFLGLEVQPGDFRFADDPVEYRKNLVLARQSSRQLGFLIHPAFRAFLEVAHD